jgi:ribosomal protein S18 acetylase RimI-like enzyme
MAALAPEDLAQTLECERRIVNAWPAVSTLVMGDWVIRFANGYSGRANSASPIATAAELDEAMLALIEELYRADGLPPCIRLTPLAGETTIAAVLARGYRLKDASFGMICELDAVAPDFEPELQIEAGPSPDWIAGVAARQSGEKAHLGNLAAIVEKIRLPAAFATLLIAGEPVANGLAVAERGMAEIGSIIVDPAQRGHGLGRRLVAGLMSWAKVQDCSFAYLQVDQTNAVAIRLYERLGYRRLYAYETRILD